MNDQRAPSLRGRRNPAVALLVASAGFLMVSLDVTIVNVALPTLARSLGAGLQELQWIVDAYTVVYAAVLMTGGVLGDIFGSRRVFIVGLLVFSAASAACGLAPSSGALIGARLVQGLGGAFLVPASLALLRSAFEEPAARTRAVAVWSSAGGAAVACGPVVGGLLISTIGWRSIFLINVVVGAVALLLTVTRVQGVAPARARVDVVGLLTTAAVFGGVTFGIIEEPRMGWSAPAFLGAVTMAIVGAIAFVTCERRVSHPMLPTAIARASVFRAATATGFLFQFAFYGQVFVLSLFFQQARGDSPLQAGLAFLPMTALLAASNLLAPSVSRRMGSRVTMLGGEVLLAVGFLALIAVNVHSPWWAVALVLLPIGVGAGFLIVPLTDRLLASVPPTNAGVVSGAFSASRQLGAAIGVALFGVFLTGPDAFPGGMRLTLAAAAAAQLVALTLTKAVTALPGEQPADRAGRPVAATAQEN